MRAVVVRSFGGPEALEVAEVPVPTAGPGQVRIRVEAAAVNPVDVATRAGVLADAGIMVGEGQVGLGWDVAGVVDEVGAGVDGFAVGDAVIGLSDRWTCRRRHRPSSSSWTRRRWRRRPARTSWRPRRCR